MCIPCLLTRETEVCVCECVRPKVSRMYLVCCGWGFCCRVLSMDVVSKVGALSRSLSPLLMFSHCGLFPSLPCPKCPTLWLASSQLAAGCWAALLPPTQLLAMRAVDVSCGVTVCIMCMLLAWFCGLVFDLKWGEEVVTAAVLLGLWAPTRHREHWTFLKHVITDRLTVFYRNEQSFRVSTVGFVKNWKC